MATIQYREDGYTTYFECDYCGRENNRFRSAMLKKQNHYCNRECASKENIGRARCTPFNYEDIKLGNYVSYVKSLDDKFTRVLSALGVINFEKYQRVQQLLECYDETEIIKIILFNDYNEVKIKKSNYSYPRKITLLCPH